MKKYTFRVKLHINCLNLGAYMYYFMWLLFIFFTSITHAEEIFPEGCVPRPLQGEFVRLPSATSTIVMLHNLSDTDLWITHPQTGTASAGWSSRVEAGNWSALALNGKSFELSCIESRPGHEQQIPCSGVLAVCQWAHASMPEHAKGTFWAGENRALSPLIAYIERRGFVLQNKHE